MFKKLLLAIAFSLSLTGGALATCTNPLPILNGSAGSVNMSVSQNTADAGCMYNVTPNQGGAPLSATNGWWTNILQGNAVLSATNPLFVAPSTSSVWPVSVASGAAVDCWNVTGGCKADGPATLPATTAPVTDMALQKAIANAVSGPIPLNVNTTTTAQTGVTPGSAQTGTVVGANTDQTSLGGIAYGAMANFGVSPGTVKAPNANAFGFVTDQVGGGIAALEGDPCQTTAKTTLPITLATAAVKVIATGVSGKKIYVCQIYLNNNAADSVAIFEATTATTCATSPIAVVGGGTSVATAGSGSNWAPNGGLSQGNGAAQVLQTTVNNNDLCIAQSAATQLSGSITYVTR